MSSESRSPVWGCWVPQAFSGDLRREVSTADSAGTFPQLPRESVGAPKKCSVPLCSPVVQVVYVPWVEAKLQHEKIEKLQCPEEDVCPSAKRIIQNRVSMSLLKLSSFIPGEVFSVLRYFTLHIILTFHFLSSNQPLVFLSQGVTFFFVSAIQHRWVFLQPRN